MVNIFHIFTKKQQKAIDIIAELHMIHRDDIGVNLSLYMVNKLVKLGVLDYDSESDVWDFTNSFFNQLVARGLVDLKSGERTYKSWDDDTEEVLPETSSNPFVGVIAGAYEELPQNMVVSGDYVFSVDEDGVPDHAYIGLANDDGSLPFDAIVSDHENVASDDTKEGVTDAPFAPSDVTYEGIGENASTDFYDRCAGCGRKFLARCSWDNFYCDECYCSGEYEYPDYGLDHGDEELGF